MLILDEKLDPYIFDDIYTPTHIEYFHTLNVDLMDFTITPLLALEEVLCPAFLVSVNNFKFYLPTSYYVLVYSEETSQLDTIKISDLANNNLPVFTFNGKENKMKRINLKILDYVPNYKFVIPFLNKNVFLCHPVAPYTWISISTIDQYKNLENKVIGDLM